MFVCLWRADLGYNAPGYRNADLHTPALDALAKNGLILEEYYVFSKVATAVSPWLTLSLLPACQNCLVVADPLFLVSVLRPVARRVPHWTLSVSPGCC